MAYRILPIVSLVITLVITLVLKSSSANTDGVSSGDIRLYFNGNTSLSNTQGVIEIYLDGEWGTICIHGFNLAAAAAACRQLGFINADSFNTPMQYEIEVPPSSVPILNEVSCHNEDKSALTTSGNLHILRCPNSLVTDDNECPSNASVAAVKCDPTKITADPYQGQVRLVDGESTVSAGIAEIYLHNEWGTICYNGMTQAAADSFCRQLGYTNSSSFTPSDNNDAGSTPIWISSTDCTTTRECFSTFCIKYPKSQVSSGVCANHSLDTHISCTFDRTHIKLLSPGNIFECKITITSKLALALGLSLGFFFLFCLIVIIAIVIACFTISTCPLYAHRVKKRYTGLI